MTLLALQAVAEPRRLAILRLLKFGERTVGDIASQFEITRPAISQHLRVLSEAGLVRQVRHGTSRLYSLDPEGLGKLRALIEEFWDASLPRLKAAAESAERRKRRRRG
jgi:DNA-binding transcriptional ArsR family regulator